MGKVDCTHEEDVRIAVNTGRWPDRMDADLRAHVERCEVCQDTATVALAFLQAGDGLAVRPLPESGAVWLKAQLRARAELARKAQQPISVAQAIAFAAVVGVLSAILGATSTWLQGVLKTIGRSIARLDPRSFPLPDANGLPALLTEHLGVVGLVVLAIVATPVAIYWVTREN